MARQFNIYARSQSPHAKAYDKALEAFRAASKIFRSVSDDYRARLINDAQFVEGKKAFTIAEIAADAAEVEYIKECNRTGRT